MSEHHPEIETDEDVEAHRRMPFLPEEDDVEAHVQPPRDSDLGVER